MNPGTGPGFWSPCDLRVVDDCGPRPIVELLRPLVFESGIVGTVTVPAGFRFDGASVPQLAMAVTGWPGIRAGCCHDYLLTQQVERRTADHVFREALSACGVDPGTAELMYQAVRMYSRLVTAPPDGDPAIDSYGGSA